jgi:hypothetical protein
MLDVTAERMAECDAELSASADSLVHLAGRACDY